MNACCGTSAQHPGPRPAGDDRSDCHGNGELVDNWRRTWELDPAAARTAAQIIGLYLEFPAWAVWLPVQGIWTAVRPASPHQPAPELPMIWVRAASARELADRMRASEQQFGGRDT
jgi:hypothetical protein